MRLEKRIKKHGINRNPEGSLADKANRMMHELRADDDPDSSRSSRIKGYGKVAAIGAASFIGGVVYHAGLDRVVEYVGGLSAKAKAGLGIAAIATATGTGVYIVNHQESMPIQPIQPTIEQRLPIESYTLTETDISRGDIFYRLLENRFGYDVRDERENYVPLRTTSHHEGNPETFLEAFRRLNPQLYSQLQERMQRARRPGDQTFQYLRPGDEIKFYSAK